MNAPPVDLSGKLTHRTETMIVYLNIFSKLAYDLLDDYAYPVTRCGEFKQLDDGHVIYEDSDFNDDAEARRRIREVIRITLTSKSIDAKVRSQLKCLCDLLLGKENKKDPCYREVKGLQLDPMSAAAVALLKKQLVELEAETERKLKEVRDRIIREHDDKAMALSNEIKNIQDRFIS